MNVLLLIGTGMFLGGALTLMWALDKIEAYRQDCENHRYAAMELSSKLAHSNRTIEQLNEQVESFLSVQDAADAWKANQR